MTFSFLFSFFFLLLLLLVGGFYYKIKAKDKEVKRLYKTILLISLDFFSKIELSSLVFSSNQETITIFILQLASLFHLKTKKLFDLHST